MKWNTHKPILYEKGTIGTKRRFAFCPVPCSNGKTYWLEYVIYKLEALYDTPSAPYIPDGLVSIGDWYILSIMPEKNVDHGNQVV